MFIRTLYNLHALVQVNKKEPPCNLQGGLIGCSELNKFYLASGVPNGCKSGWCGGIGRVPF